MDYRNWALEDYLADEDFIRYCTGKDAEAAFRWEEIAAQDASVRENMQQARELWIYLSVSATEAEKAEDWGKIESGLDTMGDGMQRGNGRDGISGEGRGRLVRMPVWRAAAAVALILVAGGLWLLLEHNRQKERLASLYATTPFRTLAVSGAEGRKTLQLPDGTEVLLNSFSELRIAPDYNKDNRRIELKGEAFFRVKEDAGKPFLVISGNTAVTVLGTAFKLRNYEKDRHCSVLLDAGKVRVESIGNSLRPVREILLPGDQLIMAADQTFTRSRFDADVLENWKNCRLIFRNAGLDEIRGKLRELYGVELVTAPVSGPSLAFTGEFDGKTLPEVLDAIGFTNGFTWKINNDTARLQFRPEPGR